MKFPAGVRAALSIVLLISLHCGAAAQSAREPLRAAVTLASDLVQYGLLQTDGGPSARFAIDYEHASGLFAGGSLANVEYRAESGFATPRDVQAVVYGGYVWRRDQWRTNVVVSRYEYPDIERDYDYTQLSVSASYRDRYFFTAAHSSDYLDIYDRARQLQAGIALPWIRDLEFSLSAGWLDYSGFFAAEFSYWNVGLSRPFGRLAVDLRYHDSSLDRHNIAGNLTHDQWVVSMTWSILPLQRSRGTR